MVVTKEKRVCTTYGCSALGARNALKSCSRCARTRRSSSSTSALRRNSVGGSAAAARPSASLSSQSCLFALSMSSTTTNRLSASLHTLSMLCASSKTTHVCGFDGRGAGDGVVTR